MCKHFLCSVPALTLGYFSVFLILTNLVSVYWYLIVAVSAGYWFLSIFPFVTLIWSVYPDVLPIFNCIVLLSGNSFSSILDISFLSGIWIANIFSQFLACLSVFLAMSFKEQKLLILMNSNLITFKNIYLFIWLCWVLVTTCGVIFLQRMGLVAPWHVVS